MKRNGIKKTKKNVSNKFYVIEYVFVYDGIDIA